MEGCEVHHPDFAQDETLCSDDGFGRRSGRHCQLLDLGIHGPNAASMGKYQRQCSILPFIQERALWM